MTLKLIDEDGAHEILYADKIWFGKDCNEPILWREHMGNKRGIYLYKWKILEVYRPDDNNLTYTEADWNGN